MRAERQATTSPGWREEVSATLQRVLAESPQIAHCLNRIRAEGYEVSLVLEATHRLLPRRDARRRARPPRPSTSGGEGGARPAQDDPPRQEVPPLPQDHRRPTTRSEAERSGAPLHRALSRLGLPTAALAASCARRLALEPGCRSVPRATRVERRLAGEAGHRAELLLDPQQLVVLGDAVAARGGAGLDLTAAGGHREVGDRRVLGLAASGGSPCRCSRRGAASAMQSRVSVRRADLVDLDQDRVARSPSAMPSARIFGLVTKMSSPTSWIFEPSALVRSAQPSQSFSPRPSSIETMRVGLHPLLVHRDHLVGGLRCRPRTS